MGTSHVVEEGGRAGSGQGAKIRRFPKIFLGREGGDVGGLAGSRNTQTDIRKHVLYSSRAPRINIFSSSIPDAAAAAAQ